jgi:hypothetical protein
MRLVSIRRIRVVIDSPVAIGPLILRSTGCDSVCVAARGVNPVAGFAVQGSRFRMLGNPVYQNLNPEPGALNPATEGSTS